MSTPVAQHYIVHLDVEATALDFSSAVALSDTVRASIGQLDLGNCTTSIEVVDDRARVGGNRVHRGEDVRYRGEFLG